MGKKGQTDYYYIDGSIKHAAQDQQAATEPTPSEIDSATHIEKITLTSNGAQGVLTRDDAVGSVTDLKTGKHTASVVESLAHGPFMSTEGSGVLRSENGVVTYSGEIFGTPKSKVPLTGITPQELETLVAKLEATKVIDTQAEADIEQIVQRGHDEVLNNIVNSYQSRNNKGSSR